jgi:phage repressor protein C with HTH and peptisase S24 domain
MNRSDRARRLKEAREACGYRTAKAAIDAFGWNINTYGSNENGNAPFSFAKAKVYADAFGVNALWLYDGTTPKRGLPNRPASASPPAARDRMVPVIGRVGADPEGAVLFATGQAGTELAPIPPGGTDKAVALLVAGHSMRGLVDDGGLIYFEDQRTPPGPDMLGHVVVVETDTEEVLVKRLLRGSKANRYDLESVAGPTRKDCKIRWAAHITAIIPPHQARRILRMSGT